MARDVLKYGGENRNTTRSVAAKLSVSGGSLAGKKGVAVGTMGVEMQLQRFMAVADNAFHDGGRKRRRGKIGSFLKKKMFAKGAGYWTPIFFKNYELE